MKDYSISDKIEKAVGKRPFSIKSLSGGCVGQVMKVEFQNELPLVAKLSENKNSDLSIEGKMLNYLNRHSHLPIPEVIYNTDEILIMTYIEGGDPIDYPAAQEAARLLSDLHSIHAPKFGFEYHTLIGGLPQPNPYYNTWIEFFKEQRLLFMAKLANKHKRISDGLLTRIEKFAGNLHQFISEPSSPSLIHGDVWGGNVLVKDSCITGFIDPAIYFGHPEIELAFTTLFHTFGSEFFNTYDEIHGIKPGFFTDRRDIYNLYPLLVHCRLFGGHYPNQVEHTLKRFGY
jgi:fructosamine-3-kinase